MLRNFVRKANARRFCSSSTKIRSLTWREGLPLENDITPAAIFQSLPGKSGDHHGFVLGKSSASSKGSPQITYTTRGVPPFLKQNLSPYDDFADASRNTNLVNGNDTNDKANTGNDGIAIDVNDATNMRVEKCVAIGEDDVWVRGWVHTVRSVGGAVFFRVRDEHGDAQVVVDENALADTNAGADGAALVAIAEKLTSESVVYVRGRMQERLLPTKLGKRAAKEQRQKNNKKNNKKGSSGVNAKNDQGVDVKHPEDVYELHANHIQVVARAQSDLPAVISGKSISGEEARLKARHLDLRRWELRENLRERAAWFGALREALVGLDFLEIETPTLFLSTPEGASEFLVATRQPGRFYALTQSPQQYKQMLMIGGVGKYFQFARCYRDEDGRSDRQPEFTQLDMELPFAAGEDVRGSVEHIVRHTLSVCGPTDPGSFPVMTYQEAIRRFGVDKPDIRFGLEIEDVTAEMAGSDWSEKFLPKDGTSAVEGCMQPRCVVAIATDSVPRELLSNAKVKAMRSEIGAGLEWDCVRWDASTGSFTGGRGSLIGPEQASALAKKLNLTETSSVFLAAGEDCTAGGAPGTRRCVLPADPHAVLGKLRLHLASVLRDRGLDLPASKMSFAFAETRRPGASSIDIAPLWVIDFPMFEPGDAEGSLCSVHHPFVAAHPEDADLLFKEPLRVRGQCYDLVLNGNEVGGGSVRIHDSDLQRQVITDILKTDVTRFSHLLSSLSHGAPPHAGLALGLDRIMQIVCGERARSLRDVIAFPKSTNGNDLLTGAPSRVTDDALASLHIKVVEEE